MFEAIRVRAVASRVRGEVCDLGCGKNRWQAGRSIERLEELGPDETFDTITMLAVLNYIPVSHRAAVFEGIYARLRRYGRLVLTCISPLGSVFLPWEPNGLWPRAVITLVQGHQFRLVYKKPFMGGLNWVYVFSKEGTTKTLAVSEYRKEVETLKKEL